MTLRTLILLASLTLAYVPLAHAQDASGAPARAGSTSSSDSGPSGDGFIVAGTTVLLSSYLLTGATATTLVALANQRPEITIESWIPVVGPWMMLADTRGYDDLQLGLTIASAIVQTLALGALIAGLVLDAQHPRGAQTAGLRILPTAGDRAAGISLVGAL